MTNRSYKILAACNLCATPVHVSLSSSPYHVSKLFTIGQMTRQIGRADMILIGEWIGQICHNETFIAGTSVGGLLLVVRWLDTAGQTLTGVQLLSG